VVEAFLSYQARLAAASKGFASIWLRGTGFPAGDWVSTFRMRGPHWTPRYPFSPAGGGRRHLFGAAEGVLVQRAIFPARDSWVPENKWRRQADRIQPAKSL